MANLAQATSQSFHRRSELATAQHRSSMAATSLTEMKRAMVAANRLLARPQPLSEDDQEDFKDHLEVVWLEWGFLSRARTSNPQPAMGIARSLNEVPPSRRETSKALDMLAAFAVRVLQTEGVVVSNMRRLKLEEMAERWIAGRRHRALADPVSFDNRWIQRSDVGRLSELTHGLLE